MAALYFEDFEVGREYRTAGRTVTETDLMMYAYLSGDLNPLHTDAEFAKRTQWGERLVYGQLVTLIAAGLRTRLGLLEGTALALLGAECRYEQPVMIGDTITVRVKVAEKRQTRRPDRGIVILHDEVLKQTGQIVQRNAVTQMVRRRSAVEEARVEEASPDD